MERILLLSRTELEDLQDNYDSFKKIGCEIYSVSCDTHYVHKAWHDHSEAISKLTYPMLADPTHALARDFDVLIEADGVAERGTFIIDPDGKIVSYEVSSGSVGRMEKSYPTKSAPAASEETLKNCSAKSKHASSSARTATRYALPSGSRVPRH